MNSTREQDAIQRQIAAAPQLDFDVPGSEPWITIKVEDGSEHKAKLVIVGIKRISDDPATGEARYIINGDIKLRTTKQPDYRPGVVPKEERMTIMEDGRP